MQQKKLTPILKWVGGKRQLLKEIIPLIDLKDLTYVEPFIGGGAVLFELQPQNAIINDYNSELINMYNVIKNSPEELINELKIHSENNSQEYFYDIRSLDREENFLSLSDIKRAARTIYLNKTCFNGLYRVNSSGYFNTPYGRYKNPNIINESTIKDLSKYLQNNNVIIKNEDYKNVLKDLTTNCFVYLDPPYIPISSSSSFVGYTHSGFSHENHIELKKECDKLKEKGIGFLQSNSDCQEVRELYKDYDIITVQASRSINSNSERRGKINEVLIHFKP